MRTMSCSELNRDESVYPRTAIDDEHVFSMSEAIHSGVTMPPVIACSKTFRVVDGFHRIAAAMNVYGATATVEVLVKDYASDAEIFADAVRYNASHGRNLTLADRARCVDAAARLGIDDAILADAMHVNPLSFGGLRARSFRSVALVGQAEKDKVVNSGFKKPVDGDASPVEDPRGFFRTAPQTSLERLSLLANAARVIREIGRKTDEETRAAILSVDRAIQDWVAMQSEQDEPVASSLG